MFEDKTMNSHIKRSRRELSIDMVIHIDIFQNNQFTIFPSFTFIPKTSFFFFPAAVKWRYE